MIENPVSILVHGSGRMGRAILESALADSRIRVAGVVVRRPPSAPLPGAPATYLELSKALEMAPGAVVLDFSSPSGTGERVQMVAKARHPLVLGTTGSDEAAGAAIQDAVAVIPVVVAPNTSAGVILLRRAIRAVAPGLALGWDASIVDRHHRAKKDAPSGTAKLLERELRDAGAERVEIVSLRQGSVVGEHAVYLAGQDEEVILIHRAQSRNAFASGALLAARFAAAAAPGRYDMEHVLHS